MKRIAIVVLCALALMSCKKENPKEDFKVSPEYTASTFFSMKPDMLVEVSGSLPSAVDYFNLKVKELNGIQFFSQTFDGEDPQSEDRAYQMRYSTPSRQRISATTISDVHSRIPLEERTRCWILSRKK